MKIYFLYSKTEYYFSYESKTFDFFFFALSSYYVFSKSYFSVFKRKGLSLRNLMEKVYNNSD